LPDVFGTIFTFAADLPVFFEPADEAAEPAIEL
jgi:hypothetical protein